MEYESASSFEDCFRNNIHFTKVDKPSIGDIIVFQGLADSFIHFGLYIGNNKFIHKRKDSVQISSLSLKFWELTIYGFYKYTKKTN